MQDRFLLSMHFVLLHECVFAPGHDGDLAYVVTEHVSGDEGGLTKYGIDQADHPHVDIAALTLHEAFGIYHDEEWTKCRCDDLPAGIDTAVFDCAVNNGMGQSIKLLQRALNAAVDAGLTVDGGIGSMTMGAVEAAPAQSVLYHFLIERQKLYYTIVDNHPSDAEFLNGWLSRNNDLAALLGVPLLAHSNV